MWRDAVYHGRMQRRQQGLASIRQVREELLAEGFTKEERGEWEARLSPARIRSFCRATKASTSIGADCTDVRALADAPDEVLAPLAALLVDAVEFRALPPQAMPNLVALLKK